MPGDDLFVPPPRRACAAAAPDRQRTDCLGVRLARRRTRQGDGRDARILASHFPQKGKLLRPAPTARPEIPLRGYIIVLAGTVIWALTGIVIKILLTQYHMETMTIAFWRVSIVTVFVFIALLFADAKQLIIARRDLGLFALYGLI